MCVLQVIHMALCGYGHGTYGLAGVTTRCPRPVIVARVSSFEHLCPRLIASLSSWDLLAVASLVASVSARRLLWQPPGLAGSRLSSSIITCPPLTCSDLRLAGLGSP